MAPTFCKDCSIRISGFFKKKFTCQLCTSSYCYRCFSKVKEHSGELKYNVKVLPGQNCLPCVVLSCGRIKREQLFLLENKQLALYLSERFIPTERCSEKYHLVDLIMEFAEKHGIKSGDDLENDYLHRDHVEELKRKAELLRIQEQRAMQEERFDNHHSSESISEQPHFSGSNPGFESTNTSDSSPDSSSENVDSIHINVDSIHINVDSHSNNDTSHSNIDTSHSNVDYSHSNIDTSHSNVDSSHSNIDSSHSNDNSSHSNVDNAESAEGNSQGQENLSTRNEDTKSDPNYLSPRHQASGKWRSLEDIQMIEDINSLTVIELKQILTANFIDYRGCCEKKELRDKVTMLYESKKSSEGCDGSDDRDLCKICMDSMIDCIFLDCAHLVSCTRCGKNLTECPICRALIVRVVHIFRA